MTVHPSSYHTTIQLGDTEQPIDNNKVVTKPRTLSKAKLKALAYMFLSFVPVIFFWYLTFGIASREQCDYIDTIPSKFSDCYCTPSIIAQTSDSGYTKATVNVTCPRRPVVTKEVISKVFKNTNTTYQCFSAKDNFKLNTDLVVSDISDDLYQSTPWPFVEHEDILVFLYFLTAIMQVATYYGVTHFISSTSSNAVMFFPAVLFAIYFITTSVFLVWGKTQDLCLFVG